MNRLFWLVFGLGCLWAASFAGAQPRQAKAEPGRFTPAPALVPTSPFPDVEQRHPPSDIYMAIQYGFKSDEVLYLYLNAPRANEVRDVLHVYVVRDGRIERTNTLRGSSATFREKGGSGMVRGREFRIRNLESKIDDVTFRTDLTVISGFRQWDIIHVTADVTVMSPAGRASYRVGGLVHPFVGLTPTEVKPFAVVGMPKFRIGAGKFDPDRLYASLTLGDLPVLPGAGMGRAVQATVTEVNQGKSRPLRAQWEDRPYLGLRPFETLAHLEVKGKKGATYEVKAELDLGPVFGVAKDETRFTMPAESKSSKPAH